MKWRLFRHFVIITLDNIEVLRTAGTKNKCPQRKLGTADPPTPFKCPSFKV
jgi:hypothetical protein